MSDQRGSSAEIDSGTRLPGPGAAARWGKLGGVLPTRQGAEPAEESTPRSPRAQTAAHVVRKRILFINQYYWPDHASTAQHLTDLAESLAAEGHDCHVLCAQGSYKPG
ncbi:MAG: hypothetical protein AB7I30_16560, partial [Isosphaeraceae bacterium]